MSDLHESLPTSDGKDLLAALIRDETVSLVQYLRLAEYRTQSRRRTMMGVGGLASLVVGAVALRMSIVTEANNHGSDPIVNIGAAALGALTTLIVTLLSSFRLRRAKREAAALAEEVLLKMHQDLRERPRD